MNKHALSSFVSWLRWSDAWRMCYLRMKTNMPGRTPLSRRLRNRGLAGLTKYFEDNSVTKDHFDAEQSSIDVMPNLHMNICAYKKSK